MIEAVAILTRERGAAVEKADSLNVELRELRARIKSLDDAIVVLTGHRPEPRPTRAGGGDLKSLVLLTLAAYGQEGVTARELAEAVSLSRPNTSEPSVSSTLSRMKGEDGTCDNRHGKWYIKVPPPPPQRTPEEAFGVPPPPSSSPFDDLDDEPPF